MFNNGTLIVYIEYDVSFLSKWSWHPTLKSLAVRDSFSLLVTYGCIPIKQSAVITYRNTRLSHYQIQSQLSQIWPKHLPSKGNMTILCVSGHTGAHFNISYLKEDFHITLKSSFNFDIMDIWYNDTTNTTIFHQDQTEY